MRRACLLALALCAMACGRARAEKFLFGADMSSVNEREACGVVYKDAGRAGDPFAMLQRRGLGLVRVRLWNNPGGWTDFSNLADVEKTIGRAKALGLKVLLDFHFSDSWADAHKQIIPAFWRDTPGDLALARKLYQYTGLVLLTLSKAGLMPDMVQLGNETNSELMMKTPWVEGQRIDWARNGLLFRAAIKAVHDAGARIGFTPRIILHIAQPENAEPWFDAATAAGVTGYDIIGISYYTKWSRLDMARMGAVVGHLRQKFGKDVMVVETAYPATLENSGFPAPDPEMGERISAAQTLAPGFPATPAGQNAYMRKLAETLEHSGAIGMIYWEPARVDMNCWGRHRTDGDKGWQNATFFDRHDSLFPNISFMQSTPPAPHPKR